MENTSSLQLPNSANSNTLSLPSQGPQQSGASSFAAAKSGPTIVSNASVMKQVPDIVNKTDQLTGGKITGANTPVNYNMGTANISNGQQNTQQVQSGPANNGVYPTDTYANTYSNSQLGNNVAQYGSPTYDSAGNQMATGAYMGTSGNPTTNGSVPSPYPQNGQSNGQPNPTGQDYTADYQAQQQINNNVNQLQQQNDSITAQAMQNIQSQYGNLIAEQQRQNSLYENSVRNSLIMSGAARADNIGTLGTVQDVVNNNNLKIGKLISDENQLQTEAQKAHYDNNVKLMDTLNKQIDQVRTDKQTIANDTNKKISDFQETQRENAVQAAKDSTIADIYQKGTTDVPTILSQLRANGNTNISANDVSSAVKNFVGNLTGYALYKQDALQAGITPLDPLSYQLAIKNGIVPSSPSSPATQAGNNAVNPIVQNTLKMIGATPDMSTSTAISTLGLDKVVSGFIQQEGGSPKGVNNNPGNIKFAGLPGQTDSGVKATDGGTFANYASPEAGVQAVGNWLQNKGNMPLVNAIALYKGVNASQSNAIGVTGSSTIDSSAPGYNTNTVVGNLTQASIDQSALDNIINDKQPPIGRTGLAGLQSSAIKNRMAELSTNPNLAGNKAVLKSLSSSLTKQQTYSDTVQRSLNTANDTLTSLQKYMNDNNINPSQYPDYNSFVNGFSKHTGGAGIIAGYNAQIATLRQEYSQVLAKGGARSVATDQEAAQLIPEGLAPSQLATVASQIKVDSDNVTADAQKQIDDINGKIQNIITPPNPLIQQQKQQQQTNDPLGFSSSATTSKVTANNHLGF